MKDTIFLNDVYNKEEMETFDHEGVFQKPVAHGNYFIPLHSLFASFQKSQGLV